MTDTSTHDIPAVDGIPTDATPAQETPNSGRPDGNSPDARAATLERFEEAARLLTETRARIEALGAAEQQQQTAVRAIEETRTQIADTASKLGEATAAALEALPALRDAVKAAETFLATIDVTRLAADLAEIRQTLATAASDHQKAAETARAENNDAHQTLLDKIAALHSDQLRAVENERNEARSAHQALLVKVAALPERTRRKHGLN